MHGFDVSVTYRGFKVPEELHPNLGSTEAKWFRSGVDAALTASGGLLEAGTQVYVTSGDSGPKPAVIDRVDPLDPEQPYHVEYLDPRDINYTYRSWPNRRDVYEIHRDQS